MAAKWSVGGLLGVCVAGQLGLGASLHASSPDPRDHVVVVYNSQVPASGELAAYYAQRRGISPARLIGLPCPTSETIDRETFEQAIRLPLRAELIRRGWLEPAASSGSSGGKPVSAERNDVWYLVLMWQIPLRIEATRSSWRSWWKGPSHREMVRTDGASVDSELTTLPSDRVPRSGPLANPIFQAEFGRPFDAAAARSMMLVTRLDGPDPATVRRLIDDALEAERHRLVGRAVIDLRGIEDPSCRYHIGDEWMRSAADKLHKAGWEVTVDANDGLAHPHRLGSGVGFYLGWYAESPEAAYRQRFPARFARGAIAYHLHSFNAATVRDSSRGWAAPLLAAGAAATLGSVDEPFLALTPRVGAFTHALLDGFTLAEAAWSAQPALSWMTVIIGDPLYRPFAEPLGAAAQAATADCAPHAACLQQQADRAGKLQAAVYP